jgi:hypothetical protein
MPLPRNAMSTWAPNRPMNTFSTFRSLTMSSQAPQLTRHHRSKPLKSSTGKNYGPWGKKTTEDSSLWLSQRQKLKGRNEKNP